MFIISCVAKVVLFFREVNNKLVSLYQLSQIPHGKNCEIRGGGRPFREILHLVIMS